MSKSKARLKSMYPNARKLPKNENDLNDAFTSGLRLGLGGQGRGDENPYNEGEGSPEGLQWLRGLMLGHELHQIRNPQVSKKET